VLEISKEPLTIHDMQDEIRKPSHGDLAIYDFRFAIYDFSLVISEISGFNYFSVVSKLSVAMILFEKI
jgi:hypothetical protein